MTESDYKSFCEMMYGAFEIYEKELTPATLKVWFATLKAHPFQDVRRAMFAHMNDSDAGQFAPKPANIIKHLTGSQKQQAEELTCRAQMQWLQVTRAIQRTGTYGTPHFKDPITAAVVSSIGWPLLCSKTEHELQFVAKNFVSTYAEFERRPLEQLPSHIAGLEDMQKHKAKQGGALVQLVEGLEKFEKGGAA